MVDVGIDTVDIDVGMVDVTSQPETENATDRHKAVQNNNGLRGCLEPGI